MCRHGLQYHKKRLTKITHNGFDYTFAYDGFGNRKSVSIAGKVAVSHDYEAKNGNLLKSTYANGWEVTYTYDNLDRVTEVKASKDGTSYTIGRDIYDKLGRVARFVDGQVSGKSCTYGYDLTDRLCEAVFDDGTAYRYTYDANDCLIKEVQTTPDGVRTVTRGYDADSRETSVACGSARVEKTFDKLADFHPSGETAGNIQQLIPMREQRTEDRQDGFHLLNIRMVNSHRSRAMAMMTGAMFPGY